MSTRSESGFTLIELLVVILIIGVLAAIAVPSFLSQRVKGQDACAKSMVKQMYTAAETYRTENNNYLNASVASLNAIESSITGSACGSGTWVHIGAYSATDTGCAASGAPAATSFCVGASSGGGSNFFIKNSGSVVTRTCATQAGSPTPHGGCLGDGSNAGSW